jgi:hypothetical protein
VPDVICAGCWRGVSCMVVLVPQRKACHRVVEAHWRGGNPVSLNTCAWGAMGWPPWAGPHLNEACHHGVIQGRGHGSLEEAEPGSSLMPLHNNTI